MQASVTKICLVDEWGNEYQVWGEGRDLIGVQRDESRSASARTWSKPEFTSPKAFARFKAESFGYTEARFMTLLHHLTSRLPMAQAKHNL